jgi:hypothetical protein
VADLARNIPYSVRNSINLFSGLYFLYGYEQNAGYKNLNDMCSVILSIELKAPSVSFWEWQQLYSDDKACLNLEKSV